MRIITIHDPEADVLHRRAGEVGKIDSGVRRLVARMLATLTAQKAVGLAAPQVGVSLRTIVIGNTAASPFAVINPVLEPTKPVVNSTERCMSVPGAVVTMQRYSRVRVIGLDRRGKSFTLDADGLVACILQHEVDHLDGILITDRRGRGAGPIPVGVER